MIMHKKGTAKILAGIMLCSAVLSMAIPCFAKPSHRAIFTVNQSTYSMDGNNQTMDVKTLLINGRSYVPVRYLAYALGVKPDDVSWNDATQTATLTLKDDTTIILKFTIGSYTYYVNGQAKQMDVTPILINERTYLPARFVAEAFGYKVDWNDANQEVLAYPPDTPEPAPTPVQQPAPPVSQIYSVDALKSGNIQPPADAKAPENVWGFPLKATRAEMHAGSQYAKVTDINGNTYNVDLGAPCYFCVTKDGYNYATSTHPEVYNKDNCLPLLTNAEDTAFYTPVIPLLETFGMPKENIYWDGKTLVLFGWDGKKEGYEAFFANSKESCAKWHDGEVTGANNVLNYPLLVINGVPYIGMRSVDDMEATVFASIGSYCSLINGHVYGVDGGFYDDKGIAVEGVAPGN
jgi:hypothetical protein